MLSASQAEGRRKAQRQSLFLVWIVGSNQTPEDSRRRMEHERNLGEPSRDKADTQGRLSLGEHSALDSSKE